MKHVLAREIVDILAAPADQAEIFQPLDRLTDKRIDRPHAPFPSRL